MNKIYSKEDILKLIANNHSFVIKGLLKLYEIDVEGEKDHCGFNKFDQQILRSIAEFYQKHNVISARQYELVQKKIIKYATQLMNMANEVNESYYIKVFNHDGEVDTLEFNSREKALECIRNNWLDDDIIKTNLW